jgi:2-keto-4-pentenoate hydratase
MDRDHASNVLDGPLSAVRHLIELLSCDADNLPLAAGEIVSTGTLTRALPVKAGETWTTKLKVWGSRVLVCDFAEASATRAR